MISFLPFYLPQLDFEYCLQHYDDSLLAFYNPYSIKVCTNVTKSRMKSMANQLKKTASPDNVFYTLRCFTKSWEPRPILLVNDKALSRMPLSPIIMILSLLTNEPVCLWSVPNQIQNKTDKCHRESCINVCCLESNK